MNTDAIYLTAFLALFLPGIVAWLFLNLEHLGMGKLKKLGLAGMLSIYLLLSLFAASFFSNPFFPDQAFHLMYILFAFSLVSSVLLAYSIAKRKSRSKTARLAILCGVFFAVCLGDLFGYSRHFDLPFPKTIYAEEYSKGDFLKVRKGMSYDEVIELLGSPLRQRHSVIGIFERAGGDRNHYPLFTTYAIEEDREQFEMAKTDAFPIEEAVKQWPSIEQFSYSLIAKSSRIVLWYSKPYYKDDSAHWQREIIINEASQEVDEIYSFFWWVD